MRKKWLDLMRIAPLALLFAGVASAQTTGTIIGVVTDFSSGKPVAGAVVVATSPALQGEQTVVTDANGSYRLPLLPPGEYTLSVQLEGYKPAERSDISLRLDKTIRANLSVVPEAVQIEEQVVRTGAAPVVNVGSAEAGAVVSQEFISSIPLSRSYEQAAIVAPTARVDQLGGISFAGAQSPENQYLIDGLNTTDPVYGNRTGAATAAAGMPGLRTSFVQELDIKTGSFNAEYGRATGGILNVVLKSGSNEYHGSVFGNLSPNFLVQPTGETINVTGEAINRRLNPSEGAYDLDFGFEVGGPILKDRLWFYAGLAPVLNRTYVERFITVNETASIAGDGTATCANGTPEEANSSLSHFADGSIRCLANAQDPESFIRNTVRSDNLSTYRNTYQWVGKLTYLLDENNSFTLSGFGAPSSRRLTGGNFAAGGDNTTTYASDSRRYTYQDENQISLFGRYGGKFLDKKLLTEVQAGWFSSDELEDPRTLAGVDQLNTPVIEWLDDFALTEFENVPGCTSIGACPVFAYTTGGFGGYFDRRTDRFAAKASASYLFNAGGSHTLKGGIDLERIQYEVTQFYSGGAYWVLTAGVFSAFRGYGNITNAALGPGNVLGLEVADYLTDPSTVQRFRNNNTSETDSFAYFLQDSYSPSFLPNLTINAGLRLETQAMRNLTIRNEDGFDIGDNWSPRLQAIYDFTGTGRSKIAGSWGRFYYAMPLDMGNRSFGNEIDLRFNLDPASCGFTGSPGSFNPLLVNLPTFAPNPGQPTGPGTPQCEVLTRNGVNNDFRLVGSGLVPTDPNLDGQYVDMFGAQAEYEVLPDLSVGVEWNARRQGNVIEDMSPNDGGFYFIGNPGKDQAISAPDIYCEAPPCIFNSQGVDAFAYDTGRPIRVNFPKPERSYDGFTVRAAKLYSQNWLAQASYTYSVLRGNYSGPYYPEYGQLDPGITGEYDLPSLMANKTGILPGDQTHQVKLYGAYVWNIGPRFNITTSAGYEGFSGQPVSLLGSHALYGAGSSFIIPRGQGGRSPFLHNVDLGAGIGYTIRPPYTINFGVSVFNVFNSKTELTVDENYTFDDVLPMTGLKCDGNYAQDGLTALMNDCPDLAYLKTVAGAPVEVNPNWGEGLTFKAPLSLRFNVALTF
jgi:hypothetical protein